MARKNRSLTLFTLAIVLATGAAFIANQWVLKRQSPTTAADQAAVVVALLDIPYGQKVEDKHIKILRMPATLVPEDTYHDPAEVLGMVANDDLLQGDVLRRSRFAEHLQGTTLAALIGPNKRAITVRVDDVVGVAGFLLPGNRVDVLATRKADKTYSTSTLVKDLKVLAVDQRASTNENDPVIVRAVTLEVDSRQAEAIVKARNEGNIQLALRNPNDPQEADVVAAPVPVAAPKVTRAPVSQRVTVIRGTEVSVITR